MDGYREDSDSLGGVKVLKNALWSAQTQRSIENFPFGSGERQPAEIIEAFAVVKEACAEVNKASGKVKREVCDAIIASAQKVRSALQEEAAGGNSENGMKAFPLVIWQTGSGTQTNMNVNEVLANMSNVSLGGKLGDKKPVHPNDDVNFGQSSNDTFPSAMTIAISKAVQCKLLDDGLKVLMETLRIKVKEFNMIVKIGRTHLMDAVPMTLDQEFSAYLSALEMCDAHIRATLPLVSQLALGGTAVGTGLNCYEGFAEKVASEVSRLTGMSFQSRPNKFLALSQITPLVCLSGGVTALASSLLKMANDMRILASGPRCGLGDLILPSNEPGSSIMPGKVNPTQCESMAMVCSHVIGANQQIILSNTYGHLDLNVFLPSTAAALLRSVTMLSVSMRTFAERCLQGTQANKKKLQAHINNSLMLVTALTPQIGYDKASEIAKYAYENDMTLEEAAVSKKILSAEEFRKICKAEDMLKPSK